MNNLPTFDEIEHFIRGHQWATVCEIRDHFNQRGEDWIYVPKNPKCKKCDHLLAYGIKLEFWDHLKKFIARDDVIVKDDIMACLISDKTKPDNYKKFIPVVINMK